MHELSIALAIVDLAAAEAARQDTGRIVAVHVKVGALSGVVPEALCRAFELAREGSLLEGAELVIQEVPVAAYCSRCAAERPVVSVVRLYCSACGTPTPELVRGQELEVVALEVES